MIRRTRVVGCVLVLLLASLQLPGAREAGPEDEVRAAVSAFGRAFAEADVPYLQSHLTKDYLHVNGRSGSVLHRTEWLDWVESRRAELAGGELMIGDYRVDALVVKIYGAAAVVTGVVESGGVRKGVPFSSRVRFTNVWVRQGGAWLRAAFHDSPVPDA